MKITDEVVIEASVLSLTHDLCLRIVTSFFLFFFLISAQSTGLLLLISSAGSNQVAK